MLSTRILLFVIAALLAGPVAADWTNFTSSCTDVVLHTSRTGHLSLLSASCLLDKANSTDVDTPSASTLHNTTLDLNLCLGIDYTSAKLTWSIYGKFSEYCASCHVVGRTKLGCSCATLSGVHANSTIDLSKCGWAFRGGGGGSERCEKNKSDRSKGN
ncbi:hypothetical protein SBRCBS47491_000863 [Sporothrix bragantina]|uniref:Cyanovirin-N domain-containing protein n=1 Tax=Sporothrix bragantina TaxID=671064 RepID=A0ABP0ATU8_9PEZI